MLGQPLSLRLISTLPGTAPAFPHHRVPMCILTDLTLPLAVPSLVFITSYQLPGKSYNHFVKFYAITQGNPSRLWQGLHSAPNLSGKLLFCTYLNYAHIKTQFGEKDEYSL